MKRLLTLWLAGMLGAGSMTAAADNGAALFIQNCSLCHQSGGMGLAGQFPRLAGRLSVISGADAGRTYLIDVLTFGMTGNITVDNQPLSGLMPPFAQISNEDVASILSYVQTLGDPPAKPPAPFTAAEVMARRAKTAKAPADTAAERQALVQAHVIE